MGSPLITHSGQIAPTQYIDCSHRIKYIHLIKTSLAATTLVSGLGRLVMMPVTLSDFLYLIFLYFFGVFTAYAHICYALQVYFDGTVRQINNALLLTQVFKQKDKMSR